MEIREVLNRLKIPFAGEDHRHGREGWVQIDCPHCGPGSGKFHLGISIYSGTANCWRCGKHRLFSVLASSCGDRRAVGSLWGKLRFDWSFGQNDDWAEEEVSGTFKAPSGLGPLGDAHKTYLARERGLDPEKCAKLWGIQGLGPLSKLKWRIYIPITLNGQVVSWTTRSISKDKKGAKYISAKFPEESIIHPRNLVFGIDFCYSSVIIHEGPMDVIRTGPGAVALLGLNYSHAQVKQLARIPRRIICLDSQPSAQAVAQKLSRDLSVFPGETFVVELDSGKDASEASEDEIQELRKFL